MCILIWSRHRAFTLIELLITLTMLCILATLMMPGLRQTLEMGYRTGCASNMRQIHMATNCYSTNNYGFLPPRGGSGGGTNWYVTWMWHREIIDHEYGLSTLVRQCPAQKSNRGMNDAVYVFGEDQAIKTYGSNYWWYGSTFPAGVVTPTNWSAYDIAF